MVFKICKSNSINNNGIYFTIRSRVSYALYTLSTESNGTSCSKNEQRKFSIDFLTEKSGARWQCIINKNE